MIKTALLILFSSSLAFADIESEKMDQAIHQAYRQVMNQRFTDMVNFSKAGGNTSEFLQSLFPGLKDAKTNFKSSQKIAGVKVPKIIGIKDGIEFFDGTQNVTITLSPKLGVLLINGKDSQFADANDRRNYSILSLLEILEPRAMAGPLSFVMDNVEKLYYGLEQGKTRTVVESSAKLAATGAGAGAVAGCLFALKYDRASKDNVTKCEEGAADIAVIGASGLALSVPSLKLIEKGVFKIAEMRPFENVETASGTVKTLKLPYVVGMLGTEAFVLHSLKASEFAKGAKLVCTGPDGSYLFEGIGSKEGYSVGSKYFETNFKLPLDAGEIANSMAKDPKLKVDSLRPLAEMVKSDMQARVELCKTHGAGYTKEYILDSTEKKMLKDQPATAQ